MIKNKSAYKTIGEVAREIGLIDKKKGKINTHTLRFWEKEFKQIKPKVLTGNRRYYSEKDVDFLRLLYDLLKNQGFTIEGAKKLLKKPSFKLEENLSLGIKNKNFQTNLKKRAQRVRSILNKIRGLN